MVVGIVTILPIIYKIGRRTLNSLGRLEGRKNRRNIIVETTWFIIFINNILHLIPYNPSYLSNLFNTLGLSGILISLLTIYLIQNKSFFKLFIPRDITFILVPLIFLLEFLSYFLRILTLSVRLTSNLLSGPILLNILSSFSYLSIIPILFLEFLVCIIQSFVFFLLLSSYFSSL